MRTYSAGALGAFALAAVMAVSAGCASAPSIRPRVEKIRTVQGGRDIVWDALLRLVAAEAETVTVLQKDSGVISFRKAIPVGDIEAVAFKRGCLLWSDATAHVIIVAAAAGEGLTRVTMSIKIVGTAKDVVDVVLYRSRCVFPESRGVLEKRYFDELEGMLVAKAAP
jgi:hypothetical protein